MPQLGSTDAPASQVHFVTASTDRLEPVGAIGLRDVEDRPDDEYDSYLLQAAGRLWNGVSVQQVADYLVNVETDIMGLGAGIPSLVRERACEVASVLRDYVIELRA